jgi:hypothetical protein
MTSCIMGNVVKDFCDTCCINKKCEKNQSVVNTDDLVFEKLLFGFYNIKTVFILYNPKSSALAKKSICR